jgi:L-ectoine synthase
MSIWYKNHLEACYVLEGEGTIEDLSTGTVHELGPGMLYALNNHDRHRLRARTRMHLV